MNTQISPLGSPNPPALFNRQSPQTVKKLGWLLILLGLALSVGMAGCAFYLLNAIVFHNQSGPHSHWTGGPEFTRTTFELFGSLFLLGLLFVTAGGYQVSTGRRNPILVALVFVALAAVIYFGSGIISASHPAS